VRWHSKIAKSSSGIMRLLFLTVITEMLLHSCWAQDLAPRAYVITPLHANAINLTSSFYTGGVDLSGLPITGTIGTYSVPSLSFYHSFSFFGPLGQHCGVAALWRRNFSGVCGRDEPFDLPFRPVGFGSSLFREPKGWPGDAHLAVREVEAKDCVGCQPESDRSDRPV
jgi:hypothetical protein